MKAMKIIGAAFLMIITLGIGIIFLPVLIGETIKPKTKDQNELFI